MPVFIHLSSCEDLDEELYDCNDADFETEDISDQKRIDQCELNDFGLRFGTINKRLENFLHQDWMRKTCLKKEWRYPTFDSEKVDFCTTFEVTLDLCIATTYRVYLKNWEFQST